MRALVVIGEGFDFAVEETGVYYGRSWVESEVEYLRAEGDDWHRTADREGAEPRLAIPSSRTAMFIAEH